MARLKSLHYGTNGTYMNAGVDYSYISDGEKASITVRLDGVSEDDALTIPVSEDFSRRLEDIIERYKLRKWDGFSKSDKNVLDGSGFGFNAAFDDGTRISASGYERYPKDHSQVVGALEGLFLPLYEEIRPDRRKVMNKYFDEVILKDCGRLEKQEACYPYISDGGNMFRLGKCECKGGAAMFPVYDTDDEPGYMLVIYLRENKDNSDAWVLSCEMYRITEKGEVLPWGSAEIDPHFFSSDKLYGHIFTRQFNGQLQLGCFTQKGYYASGRNSKFYIDLYDIDKKLEPLANEMVEGPRNNKEWWTPDKIENFVKVADKYGFIQSKHQWEKMPSDPVFASGMNDSANHRFDFLATNNHDGKFYNTLLDTPKGERVNGYLVTAKLYVH